MTGLCSCTAPAALTTISTTKNTCNPSKFAKLLIVRNLTANHFGSGSPIEEEASWSGLLSASDDTKVVAIQTIEAPELAEPTILEEGENPDGAPIREGSGPQEFTAMVRYPSKEQQAAIDDLSCEDDLAVIFVDKNGHFYCRSVDANTEFGFPISKGTFVFSDPVSTVVGGAMVLKSKLSFFLKSGWSQEAKKVVPESTFYPLTELTA